MILDNKPMLAAVLGAATNFTNLDRLLPLPDIVHWGVAGAAADVYHDGLKTPDKQMAMCAAAGVAGGLAMSFLRG